MDFPSIKPPIYPIKETIPDTAIKGKLENQVIIARKRFTRTPMSFELSWTALPEADYETLRAFPQCQWRRSVPVDVPSRRGRKFLRQGVQCAL